MFPFRTLFNRPLPTPTRALRRANRATLESMRFWSPERPGEAQDVVALMFDDVKIEQLLIAYLDQEMDAKELGYELQSLAEKIQDGWDNPGRSEDDFADREGA